jgi:hypothetical protein
MATSDRFLTIAGRWKQCVASAGLDKVLTRREQALAMMTFYAGFSASLEAGAELADLAEADAVHLLQALHIEVKQMEAMATHISSGRPAS